MCKAFSALTTKSQKVYWKTGVDSHDELLKLFKGKDAELDENKTPLQFAKIEISPENGDYLRPNKWVYKVDENIRPEYLLPIHEKLCWQEFRKWKKEVYSKINLKEVKNIINPIKIKHSDKVSKKEIELLKVGASVWASVWDSVRDSVRDLVGASVGASVWDSVRDSVRDLVRDSVGDSVWDSVGASVWDSVWASVWDSVWAYYGTLFKGIDRWKYTEKLKIKGYPFQSAVELWKRGLVPSFDGKVWRIHKMCANAKVIYEWKK